MRRVPISPVPLITPRTARRILPLLAVVVLSALFGGGGCGSSGQEDAAGSGDTVVLARVGDTEIRADYYEDRLGKLEREELPRGEDGQPLDMAGPDGKRKFLETLINKEVMVQAARRRFGDDPGIVSARQSLLTYEAGQAMWAAELAEPERMTDAEVADFYAKMSKARRCRYVVTNFLDEAQAAHEAIVGGADWPEVAERFHAGDPDPNGTYELNVPFGRYSSDFDRGVFSVPVGGVTEPIPSEFGYWVLRVDEEKTIDVPPLADVRDRIVETAAAREKAASQEQFKQAVRDRAGFVLDEDALLRVFEGLPVKEDVFYPGTKDPVRKEDLMPLAIADEDLERPLYGYTMPGGERREFTVGDYKTRFDAMSVFQRPKRAQMLGGLRSKLTGEVDKVLLEHEARRLGYEEDPDVLAKIATKVEELLVNKLYSETVPQDIEVSDATRDSFWTANAEQYALPEIRDGLLVVCADEASASAAQAAALQGTEWREILVAHGTDPQNKGKGGKITGIRGDARGALKDHMFALEPGGVSPPFPAEGDRYAVVKLQSVHPPRQPELSEVQEAVDERIRNIVAERVFQENLSVWMGEVEIEVFDENLAGLRSWRELKAAPAAAS